MADAKGETDDSVDEVIEIYLEGMSKLDSVFLTFEVTCCVAETQKQIEEHKGEVVGRAEGVYWKNLYDEILVVDQGDIFQMIPQENPDGSRSFIVPFPGPQLNFKNDKYIIHLMAVTGEGTIGEVDRYFPRQLFHPLKGLGLVGSEQFCDPLNWLMFPPSGTKLSSRINSDQSASVTDGNSIQIVFDLNHAGAISMFSFGSETAQAMYRVDSFRRLENGGWVPEKATAIAAKEGFPKKVFFYKLKDASIPLEGDRTVVKIGQAGCIINNINRTRSIRPNEGTAIGPETIFEIYDALAKDDDSVMGADEANASRVVTWPRPESSMPGEAKDGGGK